VLEGDGFSVLTATDGAEALRLCKQHEGTINIVVSEVVMPGPKGLELFERTRVFHPETKFLFVANFGDVPELNELIKYGATVLEKPFLPSELLRKVEDTLNPGNADAATGTGG
jgi:DNA-binding NtrC family response regulator